MSTKDKTDAHTSTHVSPAGTQEGAEKAQSTSYNEKTESEKKNGENRAERKNESSCDAHTREIAFENTSWNSC
jgi:hypothetical protein